MKSTSARKSRRQNSLGYQTFEPRRLLAGDVVAVEWGGHLYVRGDNASNEIALVANELGHLEITGINGTTVNGQETGFVVTGSDAGENGLTRFEGGLRVNLGRGDDSITIRGAQFDGESIIYGGLGNDQVHLSNSLFTNRFVVQTFDGDDDISIQDAEFRDDVYIFSLQGQDQVNLSNIRTHADSIFVTGEGDDRITLNEGALMGGTQLLLTLAGEDFVHVNLPQVGENGLGVFTGAGSDHVIADFDLDTILGEVIVSGQGGVDQGDGNASYLPTDEVFATGFEHSQIFDSGVGIDRIDSAYNSYFNTPASSIIFATEVELLQTTAINKVQWTGSYLNNDPLPEDDFVIDIYQSDSFNPLGQRSTLGARVANFEVGSEVIRTDTGKVWDSNRSNTSFYQYTANIDFEFAAGQTYWVAIYAKVADIGEGADIDGVAQFQWAMEYRRPADLENDGARTLTTQAYDPSTNTWQSWAPENWKRAPYFNMDLRMFASTEFDANE